MGFFHRTKKSGKNKGKNTEAAAQGSKSRQQNSNWSLGEEEEEEEEEENYPEQQLMAAAAAAAAAGGMCKLHHGLTSVEVTYTKTIKVNTDHDGDCCKVCGCRCTCHRRQSYNNSGNSNSNCHCYQLPYYNNSSNWEMPQVVGQRDMYVEAPPPPPPPRQQQMQMLQSAATANHNYYGPPPQRYGNGNGEAPQRVVPNFESAFSDENAEACIVM